MINNFLKNIVVTNCVHFTFHSLSVVSATHDSDIESFPEGINVDMLIMMLMMTMMYIHIYI